MLTYANSGIRDLSLSKLAARFTKQRLPLGIISESYAGSRAALPHSFASVGNLQTCGDGGRWSRACE